MILIDNQTIREMINVKYAIIRYPYDLRYRHRHIVHHLSYLSLSNLESLTLDPISARLLLSPESLTKYIFSNLRTLAIIGYDEDRESQILSLDVLAIPNLSKLIIYECIVDNLRDIHKLSYLSLWSSSPSVVRYLSDLRLYRLDLQFILCGRYMEYDIPLMSTVKYLSYSGNSEHLRSFPNLEHLDIGFMSLYKQLQMKIRKYLPRLRCLECCASFEMKIDEDVKLDHRDKYDIIHSKYLMGGGATACILELMGRNIPEEYCIGTDRDTLLRILESNCG